MSAEAEEFQPYFDRTDDLTCSAVGRAARFGDVDELQRLLREGSPYDVSDNRGWYPIHEAASNGHIECLKILLAQGWRNFKNTKAYNGETPIFLAALHGHSELMKILLDNNVDIQMQNNELISVLVAAVKGGNIECIKICIENQVNINSQDAGEWSALHEAAYLGNKTCTALLIAAGAQINIKNTDGATPLFTAAQYGNIECLDILIKNEADLNLHTVDGATPVFIASQEGNTKCTEALINAGAVTDTPTSDGGSSLHAAAERGSLECLRLLLKAGVCANIRTSENITPLHLAANSDNVECLRELIDAGAELETEIVGTKETPLVLAAQDGNSNCCEELLSKGCNPNSVYVENGTLEKTVLMGAIEGDHIKCVKHLLKYGADPNKATYASPLILAAKNFCQENLNLLLGSGADVDYIDRGHNAALNIAVIKFRCGIMSMHKSKDVQLQCIKTLLKAAASTAVLFRYPYGALVNPAIPQKVAAPELLKLLLQFEGNNPDIREFCEKHKDDVRWSEVRRICNSPRHLTHLCRVVIRRRLGKKRISKIPDLPIPVVLKKFIEYSQL